LGLALALSGGCDALGTKAAEDGAAAATPGPAPADPTAALADLERRRAQSPGQDLEAAAAAQRSANAIQTYAHESNEPTLFEVQQGGAPSAVPEAPAEGSPGRLDFDLKKSNVAGASAPSDLERATFERSGPWIDMTLVERAILQQGRAVRSCWDAGRRDDPTLEGRVDISLTIGTDGRASSVGLDRGSPVRNKVLSTCLEGVLGKTSYPEARGGAVTFVYPFNG
jgi:hypothetical protein